MNYLKEGPQFLSVWVSDVRVGFVVDPLSIKEERESFLFESGKSLSHTKEAEANRLERLF